MNAKTIFIILVTVLVTIVLMNNQDEVRVWLFGQTYISKLAIFGVMFGLGFIVGVLVARPRRKKAMETFEDEESAKPSNLSDEDREYIK